MIGYNEFVLKNTESATNRAKINAAQQDVTSVKFIEQRDGIMRQIGRLQEVKKNGKL